MEEHELIEKSINGDGEAFEQLTKPYYQGIINHAYAMLKNRDDALDMAQEALVKAFVGLEAFNGQSSFNTWLYRIASNVCLDEIRKRKRRASSVSLTGGDKDEQTEVDIVDKNDGPEKIAQKNELRRVILQAIGELDEEYRATIVLRELEGMDYNEIAATLGISLGTVKSRISRARIKLREKLSKYRELL